MHHAIIFSYQSYHFHHCDIIHAMKGIPFLDNGILTRNDIQYVHILKFTIWVSVMVLNVTFNNIQLNRGGQFYWWRKPVYPEKTTEILLQLAVNTTTLTLIQRKIVC
jgi:hypothetical protein